jgi:predicted helicase
MRSMIDVYDGERRAWAERDVTDARDLDSFLESDPKLISWNRGLKNDARRGRVHAFRPAALTVGTYRPFTKERVYFDRSMNDMIYQLERVFPTPKHANFGFYIVNPGAGKPFSALMTDQVVGVQRRSVLPTLALRDRRGGSAVLLR